MIACFARCNRLLKHFNSAADLKTRLEEISPLTGNLTQYIELVALITTDTYPLPDQSCEMNLPSFNATTEGSAAPIVHPAFEDSVAVLGSGFSLIPPSMDRIADIAHKRKKVTENGFLNDGPPSNSTMGIVKPTKYTFIQGQENKRLTPEYLSHFIGGIYGKYMIALVWGILEIYLTQTVNPYQIAPIFPATETTPLRFIQRIVLEGVLYQLR